MTIFQIIDDLYILCSKLQLDVLFTRISEERGKWWWCLSVCRPREGRNGKLEMADGRWRDLGLEIWLVAKTEYILKQEGLIWVYTGGGKIKGERCRKKREGQFVLKEKNYNF